jgi:hypothetical protein
VNAREVTNVPGRPKTDKLDAVWLAKLAERGTGRPSFVPPPWQRELRDPDPLPAHPHPRADPGGHCCIRGDRVRAVRLSA